MKEKSMTEAEAIARRREGLVPLADIALQVFSAQISANYLKYSKARIVPQIIGHDDVPMRELRTLLCVAHYDRGITASWIAIQLSYDPATVTRSTKWLIENDYLHSETSLVDGRSTVLTITKMGQDLSTQFFTASKVAMAELDALDDDAPSQDEIRAALRVFEKVRDRSYLAAKHIHTGE